MLQVAIISNLFFVLFTFIIFSGNWVYLQGDYYHWFRDVALGKITDMGNNFYRVVLNEHLLLIPILLSGIYQTIKTSSKKITWFFVLPLLVILSLNLTRIYFLAMIIGLLFLFTKNNWKKWIIYSVAACLTIFISFTILHLSASRGQSLGWEFFGIRIQSITQPTIEDSSLSRMLILPQAIAKINNRPLLGNGIGDEITVYSPILKQQITTSQFDWGWLEIIAEMGILGLLAWLYFIVKIFLRKPPQHLTAGLISLLIINLTSPALFHVFGIIFLILLV
jgi:O-antigen ligase